MSFLADQAKKYAENAQATREEMQKAASGAKSQNGSKAQGQSQSQSQRVEVHVHIHNGK